MIAFVTSFFGCRTNIPLQPYPTRISINIAHLTTLTSDYSLLPIAFDSLARFELAEQFIELPKEGWGKPCIARYQNPFRTSYDSVNATILVRGEVERVSYEPAMDVQNMIIAVHFGGLLGLISDNDKGKMAACVQYRFYITDTKHHFSDSFLTIGASSGLREEKSRKELMAEANYLAASLFASQLIDIIFRDNTFYPEYEYSLIDLSRSAQCYHLIHSFEERYQKGRRIDNK